MPYNDIVMQRFAQRTSKRNIAHPYWRNVAYEQDFMCKNVDDLPECEMDFNLEFHHNGAPYERVMLCRVCHWTLHTAEGDPFPIERGKVSRVIDDLDREIERAGGLSEWKIQYNIGPSPRPSLGLFL